MRQKWLTRIILVATLIVVVTAAWYAIYLARQAQAREQARRSALTQEILAAPTMMAEKMWSLYRAAGLDPDSSALKDEMVLAVKAQIDAYTQESKLEAAYDLLREVDHLAVLRPQELKAFEEKVQALESARRRSERRSLIGEVFGFRKWLNRLKSAPRIIIGWKIT